MVSTSPGWLLHSALTRVPECGKAGVHVIQGRTVDATTAEQTTRPGKLSPAPWENISARAQAAEVRSPQGRGEARAVKRDSRSERRRSPNPLTGDAASGRGAAAIPKPSASWLRAPPHPCSPAVLWKGPRAAEHASQPGCSLDAPEVPPSVRAAW